MEDFANQYELKYVHVRTRIVNERKKRQTGKRKLQDLLDIK